MEWNTLATALFGAAPVGLVPHRRSAFTFKAPFPPDDAAAPE